MNDYGLILKQDGIVLLPNSFIIEPFMEYLSECPVYQNHVRQEKPESPLGSAPWMCHDMHDVIMAPGLFELGLLMTPQLAEYFGRLPNLFSLNVFHTEPTQTPKGDIQEFHRDADDSDFVALFIYCTDINDNEDGAHQYMVGTHNGTDEGHLMSIYGKAGSMFLEVPRGRHRGLVPQRGRRTLAWIRWGVSDVPPAYQWDKLKPIDKQWLGTRYPSDPELQKAIRLVAA